MIAFVRFFARSFWLTALLVVALSGAAVATGVALRLTLGGSIALFFVVWWTLLFAILPIRISSQAEHGPVVDGSDPGAPANPELKQRAIWTTIASAIAFVLVAYFFPLAGL